MNIKFYIGFDPREIEAFDVLRASMKAHNKVIRTRPIVLNVMQKYGLMTREFDHVDGVMIDKISDAPCSTEFSISRFLTLELAKEDFVTHAVFMDCDMMVTCDIEEAVREVIKKDPDAPVWCVKHDHKPTEDIKMDGQIQTTYGMKNWSSFVIYNVKHPANDALTLDMVNTKRGLDLHQFCWLDNKEDISPLPIDFNFLVGYYSKASITPKNIHYTEGIPTMKGYEHCDYSGLWLKYYNEIYK